MKDSGSRWGSHSPNQTGVGALEHQLLFMWACHSSHRPLKIAWREPAEVWKKVNNSWFWRQLLFQWVYGTAKKKKKITSFSTWKLFRSPGLAPLCLLYLEARSSSFFTNQESQANEHLLPWAVLYEIHTYTRLEFNLEDAGEGGRLNPTSKARALP